MLCCVVACCGVLRFVVCVGWVVALCVLLCWCGVLIVFCVVVFGGVLCRVVFVFVLLCVHFVVVCVCVLSLCCVCACGV